MPTVFTPEIAFSPGTVLICILIGMAKPNCKVKLLNVETFHWYRDNQTGELNDSQGMVDELPYVKITEETHR